MTSPLWMTRLIQPNEPTWHEWHRRIWGAMFSHLPDGSSRRFLFHVYRPNAILVLSSEQPGIPATRVDHLIQNGMEDYFSLVVNPTRRNRSRGVYPVHDADAQREWLAARLDGAELLDVATRRMASIHEEHPHTGDLIHIVRYAVRAHLRITDRHAFLDRWQRGIGRKGAYGCALLVPDSLWAHVREQQREIAA